MKTIRVLLLSTLLCLSGICLLADHPSVTSSAEGISNQAVIGQVSLVSIDELGQIRNAVGTAASLVEPVRIAPQAPVKAHPGETPEVSAALGYDDGTFTRLYADEISWASSNDVIQVTPDGLLEIGEVSHRVRVRLTATAEEFSAEVLVRVDPLPGEAVSYEPVPGQGPWPDASPLGDNWFVSPWFGSFTATKQRWIYHDGLGWLYPSGDSPDNLWLWDQKQEWMWTNREVYPQIFRHNDQAWLYYMVQVKSERIFFNHSTNQLEFE